MFEITFEINGQKVTPDTAGDVIEKAALEIFKEQITENVGSIKCPEHHLGAKVIARGLTVDDLSVKISGCCQKLIDEVAKKLNN